LSPGIKSRVRFEGDRDPVSSGWRAQEEKILSS